VSDGPRSLPELLHAARESGVRVTTAQVDRPTLDDVFLALTGRSLRDAAATDQPPASTSRKDAA
jgi:ABC-2 type transport system ATP-binding protein